MATTLLLLSMLVVAPVQGGDLDLVNVRETYGKLGPTRSDAGKLLPGDVYHIGFDIQNIQLSETGEALYSMAMEVTDSNNKVHFKQAPVELTALNMFGGRTLPAIAHVDIGRDQPPGKYTVKVTVTDRASKKTKSFTRPVEVMPPSFGVVRLRITADYDQNVDSAAVAVPGQALWVHLFAVGFKRGGAKNDADVGFEMTILDDKNQPTLSKPLTGDFKELPKDAMAIPIDLQLVPNRPGKFTVKLKATDRVANKTTELSLPVTVLETK